MTSSKTTKTIKQLEAEIKQLKGEKLQHDLATLNGASQLYGAVLKIEPEEWGALLVGTPRLLREKIEAVRDLAGETSRAMRVGETLSGQIGDLERALADQRGARRAAV